jgi:hypothetical protein
MGSVVKKIKKTAKKAVKAVKKIVKKNPITKIVKKAAKGVKKLGGKLWDGIKKVGGKAMKAWGKVSQKLGPIGTIALSFAMPYLLGPLSGMAGTAWSNMATWLGTPATGAGSTFVNVFKTLGYNAMKGAQFVGSTFKGITQTLSQTVRGFAGEGGSLSKGFEALWGGTKDVFTGKAGMGTLQGTQSQVLGQTVTSYSGATIPTASGVVQTGGVNMMNANVANAQAYQAISNAMSGVTSQYTPEMAKYTNTLQNQYKIDAHTAHQHAMQNGGVVNVDPSNGMSSYNLDFNASGDFKFKQTGGPPNVGEYQYSGDASKIKFGDTNQYVGIRGNQYKVDGDTYGYGDPKSTGLLSKSTASAAMNALSGYQEGAPELALPGGYDASLDPFNTRYDGTNVALSAGGQFLSKEQDRFQKTLNLNIAGG